MPQSRIPAFGRSVRLILTVGALAGVCAATACRSTPAGPAAAPVTADTWAVIDGHQITREDVDKAYRRMRDTSQTLSEEEALTAKLNLLNDLITQEILLAKARALKLDVAAKRSRHRLRQCEEEHLRRSLSSRS